MWDVLSADLIKRRAAIADMSFKNHGVVPKAQRMPQPRFSTEGTAAHRLGRKPEVNLPNEHGEPRSGNSKRRTESEDIRQISGRAHIPVTLLANGAPRCLTLVAVGGNIGN